MSRTRRHDVAIHAPFAAPLYSRNSERWSGGAEVQSYKLARALADRGLRVCHVVIEYDGVVPGDHDGVTVVTQTPKFDLTKEQYSTCIAEAMDAADASLYLQRTAGYETGVVAAHARACDRTFVFSSSSITDLSSNPPLLNRASSDAFRCGLRLANQVVVQTRDQVELGSETLGHPPRLIRSFCEVQPPSDSAPEAFLWIGGLSDYKDPLSYIRLAELVPEASFWMLGTPRIGSDALAAELAAAAERLPNLDLLSPMDHASLLDVYPRAVAVVNTSVFEGFPNTFMEGWASGTPALSLNVDPDGVLTTYGIGEIAGGSLDALADAARRMWADRERSEERADAARRYIAENHDPDVVGDEWAKLLRELT